MQLLIKVMVVMVVMVHHFTVLIFVLVEAVEAQVRMPISQMFQMLQKAETVAVLVGQDLEILEVITKQVMLDI